MRDYVFVGHWYIQKFIDDFREAIASAFQIFGDELSVTYADSHVITGQILKFGIQPMIDDALLCIFDIGEESRPNIFLELGYAYGRNKYVILTGANLPEKASDIHGYTVITYGSFKELRNKLINQLPEIMLKARKHNKEVAAMPEAPALLDKQGTIQLLKLHRASLADSLLPFVDDYLIDLERNSEHYSYRTVFRPVRNAIQESRSLLTGFQNRKVGDIKEFVERNYTDLRLARFIKKEIEPVLKSTTLDTRAKRRELQSKIKEEEETVFNGFYEKLEDDSEDKEE